MATPHLEFNKSDIAKIVIMPGDPLRCKYIAEHYLSEVKLINSIRNNFGYTGKYKGKKISVISSGMGIPSMGIYAYELMSIFDVDYIIRIGTCGTLKKEYDINNIILATEAYSESTFAKIYNNDRHKSFSSSKMINKCIEKYSKNNNINLIKGKILTTDVFEPNAKRNILKKIVPDDLIVSEMESFALFFIAKYVGKKAASILTVSDSSFTKKSLSADERQTALDKMIVIALESAIMIK